MHKLAKNVGVAADFWNNKPLGGGAPLSSGAARNGVKIGSGMVDPKNMDTACN